MILRIITFIKVIILFELTLFAQGFDVDNGNPPPTQISPTVTQMNPPLFQQKYGLIIYPPCHKTVFKSLSGLNVSLISYGDFKPISITATDDTTFEMKLQSTSWPQLNNIENNFRLPYDFTLRVLFDSDSAVYHVNFDTLNDSLTIKEDPNNIKVKFIILESVLRIPEDISWIIFKDKDIGNLRQIRNDLNSMTELITMDEGFYACLPSFVKNTRLSGLSVNQINNKYS